MAKTAGSTRSNKPTIREIAKSYIGKIISDIKTQGFSKESPFKIGAVEKRMIDFAKENEIVISGKDVYMTAKSIKHSFRDTKKEAGIAITEDDLKNFVSDRFKMDLYYDNKSKNFTYTDGVNKFIINPNYELKLPNGKTEVVNYITATKMRDNKEFRMSNYIKVIKK